MERKDLVKAESREAVRIDNLTGLLDGFITSLDVKERTKEIYRKALKGFLEWLSKEGDPQPTRETILRFKEGLRVEHTPGTVTTYLTAVRRFFEWLESEKVYPNIARGIKGMKRPRGYLKEALTKEQVRYFIECIPKDDIVGLRDFAIINLMLRTGLRTIEVIRADIEDITKESGQLVLRVWGKGRDTKDDFVILTNEAYNPIMDYIKARGGVSGKDPLFISYSDRNRGQRLNTRTVRNIVTRWLNKAGLKSKKVTAHSLRHTTATISILNGADILAVKEMMRHSNINTTMTYIHNLNRVKKGAEKYVTW